MSTAGTGFQPVPWLDFDMTVDGSRRCGKALGGTGFQPVPSLDFDPTANGSGNASFDPQRGYLGTLAELAPGSPTMRPTYYHADLIGSAQLATDGPGAADSSPATLAYTAFGEHVTAGSGSAAKVGWPVTTGSIGATRYHYAGAHGYESGLLSLSSPNASLAPVTLQHVGARWYQPGIGRFVQRDPIGLGGGVNVYVYVSNSPLLDVDPTGLASPHGPFIEKLEILIGRLLVRIAESPEGYKLFWKKTLETAQNMRNAAYKARYGPLSCVIFFGMLGAEVGHAFEPTRQGMEDGMRALRRGMGGFDPRTPFDSGFGSF